MLYQPGLQKQYSRCTTATIYIPPLSIDTVEGCTLDASSRCVYVCMGYSVRKHGDAACRHGDPTSEWGMGTLQASMHGDPTSEWGPGVCMCAWAWSMHACIGPERVYIYAWAQSMHACVCAWGIHQKQTGHARIQWAQTWACRNLVGMDTGVWESSGCRHGCARVWQA